MLYQTGRGRGGQRRGKQQASKGMSLFSNTSSRSLTCTINTQRRKIKRKGNRFIDIEA